MTAIDNSSVDYCYRAVRFMGRKIEVPDASILPRRNPILSVNRASVWQGNLASQAMGGIHVSALVLVASDICPRQTNRRLISGIRSIRWEVFRLALSAIIMMAWMLRGRNLLNNLRPLACTPITRINALRASAICSWNARPAIIRSLWREGRRIISMTLARPDAIDQMGMLRPRMIAVEDRRCPRAEVAIHNLLTAWPTWRLPR